jgi:hypothetical protein
MLQQSNAFVMPLQVALSRKLVFSAALSLTFNIIPICGMGVVSIVSPYSGVPRKFSELGDKVSSSEQDEEKDRSSESISSLSRFLNVSSRQV